MVLENVLMLSQIAGHVILAILSLLIILPMSINLREFNYHCILFASGSWREDDGLFEVKWPPIGFCKFPIFTGYFICVISLLQIYKFGRLQKEPGFLGLFIDVVFGIFMTIFGIISAIIVTLGFIVWCSDMTERFPSCDMAAGQNITDNSQNIDTSGFYFEMGTSQFGAWGCFAISVGVAVIALLKLINNHQIRNIKVSMYLERQRLVNEDASVIHPDGRVSPPFPEF